MGIPNLTKLLKAHNLIENKSMDEFSGTIQAIDISMHLYQYMIGIIGAKGTHLKRKDGKTTTHLHGTFNKFVYFLKAGIIPIAVFDGKAPDIKSKTLQKRKRVKIQAKEKLKNVTGLNEKERIKLVKRSFHLTELDIIEVKELLKLMGIPVIQAPEEADAQCAALSMAQKVHGVISEDKDILAFGANKLILNFSTKKQIQEINLPYVKEILGLSYEQFVEICILLGTDYCNSIKNLGPMTTYKIYKETGSMEKFLKKVSEINKSKSKSKNKNGKYIVSKYFLNTWEQIKDYYMTATVAEPDDFEYVWGKPDVKGLIKLLCIENGFNEKRTKKRIDEMMRMYRLYLKYSRLTNTHNYEFAAKNT